MLKDPFDDGQKLSRSEQIKALDDLSDLLKVVIQFLIGEQVYLPRLRSLADAEINFLLNSLDNHYRLV